MAFTGPAICNNFRQDLLGLLSVKTIKVALYDNTATLTSSTSAYTTSGELASGGGYTTAGKALSGFTTGISGGVAWIDWTDLAWTTFTGTPYGALKYNSTDSNKAIDVIDFGGPKIVINGTLTIVWPAADSTHAILRLS